MSTEYEPSIEDRVVNLMVPIARMNACSGEVYSAMSLILRDVIQQGRSQINETRERLKSCCAELTRLRAIESAVREAGFLDADGNVRKVPNNLMPTQLEAEYLCEFLGAHGALHTKACPGDDTCNCAYRPINNAANKCARFCEYFARSAARGGGK